MGKAVVLASASPRRRELLRKILPDFLIVSPFYDEAKEPRDEAPAVYCLKQAEGKGAAVSARFPENIVISADTMVYFEGRLLGKPKDASDAFKTLKMIQGKIHEVCTGWSVWHDSSLLDSGVSISKVKIFPMSDDSIREYVATGSPLDKAGSYGIQDSDYIRCDLVEGSFDNVMGFPVSEIRDSLRKLGVI